MTLDKKWDAKGYNNEPDADGEDKAKELYDSYQK